MTTSSSSAFQSLSVSTVLCVVLVSIWSSVGHGSPISSDISAMSYLQKFGYMNESSGPGANLLSEAAFKGAVREFQRFAQLNESGILDQDTLLMMNTPRCGNTDAHGHHSHGRRSKRYALQGKLSETCCKSISAACAPIATFQLLLHVSNVFILHYSCVYKEAVSHFLQFKAVVV